MPLPGDGNYTWTSSNPDVATVDANGVVTGVGIGHTTITAYNEETGLKAKAIINVYRNVDGAITVPQVVSGNSFTVVLKEDGTVWETGRNNVGQLGDGSTTNRNTLEQVKIDENTYLTNVIKISAGREGTVALTLDGKVYVWGYNANGQLAQGDTANLFYAKLAKIDENTYIENVIDISAGDLGLTVLTNTGKVYVAGQNLWYQNLSTEKVHVVPYLKDTGLDDAIKIEGGYSNCSAMLSDGKTVAWGHNGYGALETKPNPTLQYVIAEDVVDIKLNAFYTIIQKENGEIYVTGRNDQGQLGLEDWNNRNVLTKIELPKDENGNEEEIKYISGTANNTMLMTKDGKIYVTGYNGYGQLCTGDTNNSNTFVSLVNKDGSRVTDALLLGGYEENSDYQTDSRNLSFIRKDGSIWLSGDNTYGQIGNGTNTSTNYLTAMGTTTEASLNKRNEYIKTGETLDLDVLGGTSDFNVFVKNVGADALKSDQTGYTWTSSNPDVATVDANGLVTGTGTGHTTITAYNEETGLKAKAIINVYRNVDGAITVPQVASGEGFTVVLKEDGTVWTTGQNDQGQLGDGTTTNRNKLEQVKIDENTYLTNIKKISVGYAHAIALTKTGEVYAWGTNNCGGNIGVLGQGDSTSRAYATKVKGEEGVGYLENIIDIACGDNTTYALNNEGIAFGCGASYWYQITDSTRSDLVYPTQVTGVENGIKLTAGYSNMGVIAANGEVWVKGHNSYGAFGNGTAADNGGIYLVGKDINEFEISGYFGAILKEDGTLWTTGRNEYGQLGLGDTSNRTTYTQVKYKDGNVVKAKTISLGDQNLQFIGEDGKVYVAGYNGKGQLSNGGTTNAIYPSVMKNENGTEVTDGLLIESKIKCFYSHNVLNIGLIRKDGTVWLSGDNTYGQIGNGTNESTNYLTPVGTTTEISLNKRNEYIKTGETLDLDVLGGTFEEFNVFVGAGPVSDQTGWTWTSSNPDVATVDQNGLVTGIGIGHTTITAYSENGLKGKAIINVYRNVEGAVTVPQVASGEGFTVVLKEDGTVWAAGINSSGQLGDGTTTNRNTLEQVKIDENTYLTDIRKVVLGHSHALALTKNGEVYGWGWNPNGILGTGDTINKVYAEKVKGVEGIGYLENIIDISTGYSVTLATDKDGKLYGWTRSGNEYGLMGIESNANVPIVLQQIKNVISVNIGFSDGATILANGETWVWGYNNNGSVGNGSTGIAKERMLAKDIDEIKFDGYSGYYIKEDGTLWASGRNHCGQLGIGDTRDRSTFTQVIFEDGTPVTAKTIEAGVGNATFIGTDGKAYAMGYNGYGQLCDGTTQNATYPTVLKYEDGTEVTDCLYTESGTNPWNTLSRNIGIIRKDGTVWLSGDNTYGQIGNGTNTSTNYLTPMKYLKTSIPGRINMQVGEVRTLTDEELTCIRGIMNVFGEGEAEITLIQNGEIQDSTIATCEGVTIEAKAIGETVLKLEEEKGIIFNIPVTVVSDDATLELVEVNDILRNPTGEDDHIYEVGIPKLAETAKVRVKARSKYGIVRIGENEGTASEQTVNINVSLSEDRITVPVEVTASDGVTVQNYTIILIKQSNEARLNKVAVNGTEIENKNNAYTYYLGEQETSAHVEITTEDNNAKIVVEEKTETGYLEFDETIEEGTTKIVKTIKVLAEDGTTEEYTLIISRKTQITVNVQPKVVAGSYHYIALKANGSVWGWGLNGSGQLGIGNNLNQAEPVKAKAELEDGTIEEITDAIDVSAGLYHTIVLRKDGTVWSTGRNDEGQLGNGTTGNTNIFHKVKLNSEGDYLENIIAISAGGWTSYALTEDGDVYGWGYNGYGQLGIGNTTNQSYPIKLQNVSNIIQISVGNIHAIMLEANGSVWGVGCNGSGRLGLGYVNEYIAIPQQMKTEDGTEILYGVKEISAGDYHTVILKEDGTVWGTGRNSYGQLGVGSNVVNANLYQVKVKEAEEGTEAEYVTDAKHIQAGGDVTYISRQKTEEGKNTGMYVIGYNGYGGLFTQDTGDRALATPVEEDKDILTMAPLKELYSYQGKSAGGVIVDEYGNVYTVGDNECGQLGNGTRTKSIIPICINPTKLEVTPESITYNNVGQNTKTITCNMTMGFNLLKDYEEEGKYTFTSNNENVVTVDETGRVIAKSEGTTTITVREIDTGIEKEIPVNVIIETIQKITGQITTENLEGKYKGTVKLYRRKRKDEDVYGDEDEDLLVTETETDEEGKYVLDIDEIGVYDVLITKSGYLSYKIAEIEIKEGAIVEIEQYKLIAGDVAVDGEIEIDDLVDMNRNVGKELTEENAIYDLNEDGKIDMEDRKILKKNYGKKAEQTKWINPDAEIETFSVGAPFGGIPVRNDTTVPAETTVSTNNAINNNPDVLTSNISSLILPLKCDYTITSTYGYRIHPTTGENKLHAGIDLVGDHHTEILAVADGEVTYAGVQNGYGNCIEIKHIVNGETIYSFYAHLSKIKVKVGEKVSKGEVIGLEGGAETDENHGTSTGHHLHFEIRTASGSGHSVDPTKYIKF